MTTTARDLNNEGEIKILRKQAIGGQKVLGMAIDEELPASFRKQGDPVTMKVTSEEESSCKYCYAIAFSGPANQSSVVLLLLLRTAMQRRTADKSKL
jgi:hypothetical protein